MKEKISKAYKDTFGKPPTLLVKAPGRINLIGEHTDYNLGWVFPASIDKYIYVSLGLNEGEGICVYSSDYDEYAEIDISQSLDSIQSGWQKYFWAAAKVLADRSIQIKGINLAFGGTIPLGAGMSSSAALCCGLISGLNSLLDCKLSRQEIALLAQATEHKVGLNCGLMDQYGVLFGKGQHAMLMDCKDNSLEYIPLNLTNESLVLINSGIKHELAADSGYNERRASCEKVVKLVGGKYYNTVSLRDVDFDKLLEFKDLCDPVDYKRALYVLEENERLFAFKEALINKDWPLAGKILFRAHEAMRTDYEITTPEIDLLVDLAKETPGVYGARMMGGGFGGCTLNLIKNGAKGEIIDMICRKYKESTQQDPAVYEVHISNGLEIEML